MNLAIRSRCFITVGKAGSDIQADAEALGTYDFSCNSVQLHPNNRRDMLKLVVEQLARILAAHVQWALVQIGFSPCLMQSGRALLTHYFNDEPQPQQLGLADEWRRQLQQLLKKRKTTPEPSAIKRQQVSNPGADMCPECGTISLIRAEGCRKCLTCGYSEC